MQKKKGGRRARPGTCLLLLFSSSSGGGGGRKNFMKERRGKGGGRSRLLTPSPLPHHLGMKDHGGEKGEKEEGKASNHQRDCLFSCHLFSLDRRSWERKRKGNSSEEKGIKEGAGGRSFPTLSLPPREGRGTFEKGGPSTTLASFTFSSSPRGRSRKGKGEKSLQKKKKREERAMRCSAPCASLFTSTHFVRKGEGKIEERGKERKRDTSSGARPCR